jgi:hypothetical protein
MNKTNVISDGSLCPHCNTPFTSWENTGEHNCFMRHLHEQLESKRKRKKRKKL